MIKKPTLLYYLEDILDTKCGGSRQSNRKLAAHLVRHIRGARTVRALNGFCIGRTLLVIREGNVPVKHLVVLDPSTAVHLRIDDIERCATHFQ